jgi:8-amino-7-oxononanoate synthase
LEEAIAEFTGRQRALLFSTGYMANLGAINALTDKGESLYQDRLNHASLMDAGRLSDAKMWRYQHSDMDNLRQRIARSSDTASIIVTDGVFSMDGDGANLSELSTIAAENQSWLMVDDAHGFGVLGKTGAGLVEQAGLNSDQVPVLMATLGKGVGTAGAFIAGDHDLIEFLIQSARTYIFTTAMPPAIAAAGCKSLELIQKESWRRTHLQQLIAQFKQGAAQLGLPMMPSDTAIQPILVGGSDKALDYSQQLLSQGILVTAIRPPTVPAGEARLRITLSAAHTTLHVEQLLSALEKLDFSAEK